MEALIPGSCQEKEAPASKILGQVQIPSIISVLLQNNLFARCASCLIPEMQK